MITYKNRVWVYEFSSRQPLGKVLARVAREWFGSISHRGLTLTRMELYFKGVFPRPINLRLTSAAASQVSCPT
jgi:hypothetical protein